MKRLEERLGDWVIRHRRWIIVTTLIVVFSAASGVRFLTFNNDMRVFFSEENPQLQALEALERTYTKNESVLFVLAPRDGNVFTGGTLSAVEKLTQAAWKIPYSSRVDSISNFQHTRAEQDDLFVGDLIQNPSEMSEEDLERVKRIALSEPLLVNRVLSSSGHVTGVNVNVILAEKSQNEVTQVADFARRLADQIREEHPNIDVYISGGAMFDNAFGEATRDDMRTLVPLMFATLVVITALSLRSATGTLVTLAVVLMSMITGVGLAGWFGVAFAPASANAPTIILTLAVANSIHILVTMFREMGLGKTKHEAIAESLRVNLRPVFLTSLTTAIGFLTMNFSDAPPFRDMGNIVAMGVTAAFVYSLGFLPAVMAILPVRVRMVAAGEARTSFDRLADFVIAHRRAVLWGTVTVSIGLFAGVSRIELNDDWVKYFSKRYEIRRATDFINKSLSGMGRIEYSLSSGEPDGINEPEFLATVEDFVSWYRQQPKVVHVNAITDTVKRLNKNMHGDDASYYRVPARRDLVAQYLLLYEMSLPFGLDLNDQINVDRSATRMVVTLREMTTREQREMDEKARAWLKANAAKSMFTYGSGVSIIWAHLSERNIRSMLGASFGALVVISGILVFALQSVRLGLVSLIPNLAPAFIAFGVWGLVVGRVGLGLSVIVSMTLGIVVDDAVHFLSKYIRARRELGMEPKGAVRYAFRTVGAAIWMTTVILVAGFSILALSGFKINSDMGLMTAVTITLALILDFLLLPTLLMGVDERGKVAPLQTSVA